jgi:hypothetical protein
MRSFQRRVAILAAILGALIQSGCVVVDDPQHCANREGDKTCEELYAPGVRCSACDHFHHGCVAEPPEPECRVEDTDADASSEDDGSSDGNALACDDCPDDDAGRLEAVR